MNAVTFGGVFAPPTIAHWRVMTAGLQATGADRGVWIPANLSYARAWRAGSTPEEKFLRAETRMGMLRAMIASDARMEICEREILTDTPAYTYDTLSALKKRFSRVWVLIGSDNLKNLPRWYRAEDLLNEYSFFVFERNRDAVKAIVESSPLLAQYAAHIATLPLPEEIRQVSATRVRALIDAGDWAAARALVRPEVFAYIAKNADTTE